MADKQERRQLAKDSRQKEQDVTDLMSSIKLDEPALKKLGDWVRNRSGLECVDAACFSRRVEFFKGDELIDCLTSDTFKKKKILKNIPKNGYSRVEATALAEQMQAIGFYTRASSENAEQKEIDEMHVLKPVPQPTKFVDGEEDYYIWTLPQSNTRVLMQSALFLVVAVFIAAIKAWPIWLKIFVWWCSLVLLICLSSMIVIRIVVYCFMTLIGFRGIWLLPNMFNDDLDFLDCFEPLFGIGFTPKAAKLKAKQSLTARGTKKEISKKNSRKAGDAPESSAEKADKAAEEAAEVAAEAASKAKEDAPPGRCDDWNFGLINVAGIVILGIVLCNYTGMFMPDNIPDFVVNKDDLFAQFPSLAPPNETLAETVTEETVVDGVPSVEGEDDAEADPEVEGEYKEYQQHEELGEEEAEELDE